MADQALLSLIVVGIFGLAAWFFKRTLDSMDNRLSQLNREIQDNKNQQNAEIQSIRQNYLHRDDFKEFKIELRAMFEEIKNDLREFKNRV